MEHGGKIIFQIDHGSAATREGQQREVIEFGQLFEQPAHTGTGDPPTRGQFGIIDKRIPCAVSEIRNWSNLRAAYLLVLVNRRDPKRDLEEYHQESKGTKQTVDISPDIRNKMLEAIDNNQAKKEKNNKNKGRGI